MKSGNVRSPIPAWVIGALFFLAGANHFVNPSPYLGMMPSYLPWHTSLVALSGIAEMGGGIGVFIPRLRSLAAWGLILLLVAVFPANIQMTLHGWPGTQSPTWVLWLRLPLQPIFIYAVYRYCIARFRTPAPAAET